MLSDYPAMNLGYLVDEIDWSRNTEEQAPQFEFIEKSSEPVIVAAWGDVSHCLHMECQIVSVFALAQSGR